MPDFNILTPEARERIANHLRHAADRVQLGQITPDDFNMEPEWSDAPPTISGLAMKKATGRIRLNFSYWLTPIDKL